MVCIFFYKLLSHGSFLNGTVIVALTKEVRLTNEAHVGEMNFHDTPMRTTDVHNLNVCGRVDYCFSVVDIIDDINNNAATLQDIFLRLQSHKRS